MRRILVTGLPLSPGTQVWAAARVGEDQIVDPFEAIRAQSHRYNCRVCGSSHSESVFEKLSETDRLLTVKVTCQRCHTAFIIAAELQAEEPPSRREPSPLRAGFPDEPVSTDEVLDAHLALEAMDGPLTQLLQHSPQAQA
jgi:hypothetical protein